MPDAVSFIDWANYEGGTSNPSLFGYEPLSFNSRQKRLHDLCPGDRLWLVSRCPHDRQYYFVAILYVANVSLNLAGTAAYEQFGKFAVHADRSASRDLGRRFPCEGLLRAFAFDSQKPIKHGANIGQSLQTIRFLADADVRIAEHSLGRADQGLTPVQGPACSLWTKCDPVFSEYFLVNWHSQHRPLAFLLYDSPPPVPRGAPVFIHSDRKLRIVARFRTSQYVAGHKKTVDAEERSAERERVWLAHRVNTVNAPTPTEFCDFWAAQEGVRSLIIIDDVTELRDPPEFKQYGRSLEWGYPRGVGFRLLDLHQSYLLLRQSDLDTDKQSAFISAMLA